MRSKYDNKLLEEAYKIVLKESDTDAGKIPVSAVEDLSFITVADRTTDKWVTWEVSFTYQGQEYTGFIGAVPDHPSEMHDDYIEDAEPVQAPSLDEAEESTNKTSVMKPYFEDGTEIVVGDYIDHDDGGIVTDIDYKNRLVYVFGDGEGWVVPTDEIDWRYPEAEEGSDPSPVDAFYKVFETFLDSLSDHELKGAVELLNSDPDEIKRMFRSQFGYRNEFR